MDQRENGTLRVKLQQIEQLEKDHKLLGVRFALKERSGGSHPTTEDVVDLVHSGLIEAVDLFRRIGTLQAAAEYPPK